MDDLAAMQVFVRVVETGGFSAAGRALGMAPSSVSRRIGELEASLDSRLFRRTTRKLSLTEAGSIFFERSRQIVAAVEEARLAVTQDRAAPSGILRISVPSGVAQLRVATAVAAFHERHAAVRIVMAVTDRLVDIVDEGWDIAIRIGRLEDSSLVARKLGEGRRILCANPSYLERAGRPGRPVDLDDHACLTFRGHPGSNTWRFRKGDAVTEVRATGPLFADNGEALVEAACAGMGLVLMPEWLVGDELARGRLVEVLSNYTPEPAATPFYALYAPGPYTAPKIRVFVDFMADRFSSDDAWSTRR